MKQSEPRDLLKSAGQPGTSGLRCWRHACSGDFDVDTVMLNYFGVGAGGSGGVVGTVVAVVLAVAVAAVVEVVLALWLQQFLQSSRSWSSLSLMQLQPPRYEV